MFNLAPRSPMLNYDEAWLYCICMYHNGYSDWEMPKLTNNILFEVYGNKKVRVVPVRDI